MKNKVIYIIIGIVICVTTIRELDVFNYYVIEDTGMKSSRRVFASSLKEPNRLDIVIVETEKYDLNTTIISRLVGVPGDTLLFLSGMLYVNGENIDKILRIKPSNSLNTDTIILGPNKAFLIGDNRLDSHDSRHYGPIDIKEIIATEL
ncbi:MAG: signal peptidase I [Bacteroidales bacterium]|jgi:signal peptidase I|nr:signal peptidase I [Bacteroidales bacterium]